jgi:3-methyladenine DNA glycosylase AlkD
MNLVADIVKKLKAESSPKTLESLTRFGIFPAKPMGVTIPVLRKLARTIEPDHQLALQLWDTGLHEVKILASMIDRPEWVTRHQMNAWAEDMDSWDIVDQTCGNLFDKTPFAVEKAIGWSNHPREFVKRCAFVIMAWRAVHMKKVPDDEFYRWFPIIEREAGDDRLYVKKAVNWSLRQIGKRNAGLRKEAVATARRILRDRESAAARWIARDAIKELEASR